MTEDEDKHCTEILEDGSRCGAWRCSDDDRCFYHSPKHRKEADKARARGGRRNYVPLAWDDMELDTLDDAKLYLARGLNDLRKGAISPAILTAMASGVSALGRIIDLSDLDHRIEVLEAKVNKK